MSYEINVHSEAERCAKLAEELARRYEASAAKSRKDGEYSSGWPFRKTFVRKAYEDHAKSLESAAVGCRAIAQGCRAGWDVDNLEVAKTFQRKANKV